MNTTAIGMRAEEKVVEYLLSCGYAIVDRNWKTRTCEIDIVASKGSRIYFIEVKFRSSERQGNGFEYITPAKQNRMRYAAEVWTEMHRWGGDYSVSGASVTGYSCEIEFIPDVH